MQKDQSSHTCIHVEEFLGGVFQFKQEDEASQLDQREGEWVTLFDIFFWGEWFFTIQKLPIGVFLASQLFSV